MIYKLDIEKAPMSLIFGIVASLIIKDFIENYTLVFQYSWTNITIDFQNSFQNLALSLLACYWIFYIIFGTFIALNYPQNNPIIENIEKGNLTGKNFFQVLFWRFIEFLSLIFLFDIATIPNSETGVIDQPLGIIRFSWNVFFICALWILWKGFRAKRFGVNLFGNCTNLNRFFGEIFGLLISFLCFGVIGIISLISFNHCQPDSNLFFGIECFDTSFNYGLSYILMYVATILHMLLHLKFFDWNKN